MEQLDRSPIPLCSPSSQGPLRFTQIKTGSSFVFPIRVGLSISVVDPRKKNPVRGDSSWS